MPNTITHNDWQADIGVLAEREAHYLLGFVQGLTGKEVAREFGVSPNTVRKASVRIMTKLDAWKMTEAIAKAMAAGIVRHLAFALMLSLSVGSALTDDPIHRNRVSQRARRHQEDSHVTANV